MPQVLVAAEKIRPLPMAADSQRAGRQRVPSGEAEDDEGSGGEADLAFHGPDGRGVVGAVEGVAFAGPGGGAAGEGGGGDVGCGEFGAGGGGAVAGGADHEEGAAGGCCLEGGQGGVEVVEGDVVGAGEVAGGVFAGGAHVDDGVVVEAGGGLGGDEGGGGGSCAGWSFRGVPGAGVRTRYDTPRGI